MVLPQGMANSLSMRQYFVDSVLHSAHKKFPQAYLVHYMDDILLSTSTHKELQCICEFVISCLQDAGLTVATEKIQTLPSFQHFILKHTSVNYPKISIYQENLRTLNDFPKQLFDNNWIRFSFGISKSELSEGIDPALTGLHNLGSTCYMNSVLQCLYNIPNLANYFYQNHYKEDINRSNPLGHKGNVAEEFGKIIKALWAGQHSYINPKDFKMTIGKISNQFVGDNQQDPHELLLFLMEALHQDLNKADRQNRHIEGNSDYIVHSKPVKQAWQRHKQSNESIITTLFQGQLKTTIKCLICHQESQISEIFIHLSLPLTSTDKCMLQDCLKVFFREEELKDNNKVYCSQCNTQQDSLKRTKIWKLPPVLLIHLKRYFYEDKMMKKLQTYVDFPLENLDLSQYHMGSKYISEQYNLFSVLNHYGELEKGHCTAYCKNSARQCWFRFDDEEISEISKSSVKSSAAYILFYTSKIPVATDIAI
ncbi:ubiquitin carboxyl-terminal hydrolase 8-like [Suncus etruscus]|uniref:ubiquitin carboxyl-terminal hydrolase 8-like n=1 Tax=Suncus etruscus TaxID=109475 RepID=UPI0021100AF0|nr:ubiquitin carboxyl-terminal hydrolase 8-like [Suncus etruscus]